MYLFDIYLYHFYYDILYFKFAIGFKTKYILHGHLHGEPCIRLGNIEFIKYF